MLCGGDFELKRCDCGRFYCAAHGFGGKCFECQSTSMGKIPSLENLARGTSSGESRNGEGTGKELIPRIVRASFSHDLDQLEDIRGNLVEDFRRYRPVFFGLTGVESNHETRCFYDIQYVITRVVLEVRELRLATDLEIVPEAISSRRSKAWTRYASERPLEDRTFTYLLRFIHNEMLFLCELVLRSLGVCVGAASNDLPMEKMSPRILGNCPWCGTVSRGLARCNVCGKAIPREMEPREYIVIHAKSHYRSRLVALRSMRMKEEVRKRLVAQTKSRLRTLEGM